MLLKLKTSRCAWFHKNDEYTPVLSPEYCQCVVRSVSMVVEGVVEGQHQADQQLHQQVSLSHGHRAGGGF